MKTSNTFVRLFTTTLALLGALLATPLPAATPAGAIAGKAVVAKVTGKADYVDASGNSGTVREDDPEARDQHHHRPRRLRRLGFGREWRNLGRPARLDVVAGHAAAGPHRH